MNKEDSGRHFQLTLGICGYVILATGLLATLGWIVGIHPLNRVSESFIPMAWDTALAFVIFGVVLLAYHQRSSRRMPRVLGLALAGMVGVYGFLKALEYSLGTDLTFADFLFPTKESLGSHVVGRMSSETGAQIFLSGVAAVALLGEKYRHRLRMLIGGIGLVIFFFGFIEITAYLLGAPFGHKGAPVTLAATTAFAFCFLGVGLTTAAGPEAVLKPFLGSDVRSRVLRVFVPLVVLTCLVQEILHRFLSDALALPPVLTSMNIVFFAALAAIVFGERLSKYLTKRLRVAAQSLEDSEELYASLFENMLNGYAYCKMLFDQGRPHDFIYLNVNSAFQKLTGLQNASGRKVSELIPGIQESNPELFETFGRVALTGIPERFETYVEALKTWFSISVYCPAKEHFVAVFDVITERKQAEEDLRRSRNMLSQIVDSAPLSIFWKDRECVYLGCNELFAQAAGLDRPELIVGKSDFDLPWAVTQAEAYRADDREVMEENRSKQHIIEQIQLAGGTGAWIDTSKVPLLDETGRVYGMLGVYQDITERKQAEVERAKLEAQLRQAQKLETIGTLAGGIAHDFNNILTPIMVYAHMAAKRVNGDHPARSDLEHIIAGANRATDLVKQILTFSRQTENERIVIELSSVVKEALKLLQASLPSTIEIQADIQAGCGEVLADPSQIHQVLMNLCTNAYYAMRENGGELTVKLESITVTEETARTIPTLTAGEFVRLTVSDTGGGMNEKTQERIFEPFFTTKKVGEGTGLGLSVVHGIVVSHNGAITVQSEAGKGTVFEVYLPRIRAAHGTQIVAAAAVVGGDEQILVVDDEPEVANAFKEVLEGSYGYVVTVRTSSVDALELLRTHPNRFDVVITDLTMPHLTGDHLAREIRVFRKDLPIILVTGFSQIVDTERFRQLGITGFLQKPTLPADLARMVRKVLDGVLAGIIGSRTGLPKPV